MKGQLVKLIKEGGVISGEDGKDYFFYRAEFGGYWTHLIIDHSEGKPIFLEFIVRLNKINPNLKPRATCVYRIAPPKKQN